MASPLLSPAAAAEAEPALFQTVFLRRRSPWESFSASLAVHVAVVYLGGSLASFVAAHPFFVDTRTDLASARILELDIQKNRLYDPPQPAPVPHPPAPARSQARLEAPVAKPQQPAAQPAPKPLPAPKPVKKLDQALVEAANAAKLPTARETLIQLDTPPQDIQSQLQVPRSVILTNTPKRVLPRPLIRPPELPPQEIPKAVILDLDAPRLQASAGQLPVPPASVQNPSLSVIPASKAPVSGPGATAAEVATGNWKTNEAPALVALPQTPIPPQASVVVPPAVQTATGAGNGAGSAAGGGTSGAERASTTAPSTAAASGGAAGVDTRNAPGPGPGASAVLPLVQRITLPHDGKYEVVVSQNAGIVPGSTDFLSGRPVYSVYVHAGDKKDWILQYCLPSADAAPRRNSAVIKLGGMAPLSAPYAFVMLRPSVAIRPDVRYALVHGFINTSGRLEQLAEVGEHSIENLKELLQALAGWEFRPATKDGQPAAVEILLCIPNVA